MAGGNTDKSLEPCSTLGCDNTRARLLQNGGAPVVRQGPRQVAHLTRQNDGRHSETSPTRLIPPSMSEMMPLATSGEEEPSKHEHLEHRFLDISLPTTVAGPATFGYQRALLNRMDASKLARGAAYDHTSYKPTFLHDTLMLPGTLANFLGKASSEDLVPRMTPALLTGCHAHIDLPSMQPVLVVSPRAEDHVQGMLVFGLGKEARDSIRSYYRRFAHRRRAVVEFDVCVETATNDQSSPDDHWHIERRAICAYAWFKTCLDDCDISTKDIGHPTWHLRDYLEGKLQPRHSLRIEPTSKGDEDEDGYIGREIVEHESEPEEEERDIIYGGAGSLEYQRATCFTGFW